jgi:uncharacterized cupin superfamily protein
MSHPSEPARPVALPATTLPEVSSTRYPEPFRALVAGRHRRRLGDAFGLTQFGVNLCRLEPGAASSQRHWHAKEDELVYVLEGEVVLVTDAGETVLGPGMVAGFPAGRPDGHHLVNRSARDALLLEIGTRSSAGERAVYPDIDLLYDSTRGYLHRDGTPW